VVNTNLATAAGVLTWIAMDAWLTKEKKPAFLGAVNGMICGLVGITPCAGWVNGQGAILIGVIVCAIVWVAWNFLSKVRPFSRVDDALGVVYTHGIAGLFGGLMLGLFGDPGMLELGCGHLDASGQVIATTQATYAASGGKCVPFSVNGLFYTGSAHQLWEQTRAAVFVIFWSALITFILMKLIGLVLRGARYKDEILEVGDLAIHGEEAFPEETFAERVGAMAMAGDAPSGGGGGGDVTISDRVDDGASGKPGNGPPSGIAGS
jgi:Amt family ammonium transporter